MDLKLATLKITPNREYYLHLSTCFLFDAHQLSLRYLVWYKEGGYSYYPHFTEEKS